MKLDRMLKAWVIFASSCSALFSEAHLLNWATLGKVCSAEGDSGRMWAQAMVLSPFFSTRGL